MAWPSERSKDGGVDEVPLFGVPGRLFLCGKHAVGPDPEALLARIGATTLVCLIESHEFAERYPLLAGWLDEHAPDRALHVPIPDFHAPELDVFAELVDALHARLRDGESILLHCGGGYGRTGTVAAGVLLRLGSSLDGALEVVRTARPMAGPEVGAQADVLRAYAQRLHG